jgi:hypothetical protein
VNLLELFSWTTGEVTMIGLFVITVGAVVGAIGSAIAVSRFLDV